MSELEKLQKENEQLKEQLAQLQSNHDILMDTSNTEVERLNKENQLLRKTLDNLKGDKASDKLVNAVNAYYEPLLQDRIDDIERLKKELAEKDKEIDVLTVGLQLANQYSKEIYNKYVKDNKNQLRHEICEKIRNEVNEISFWDYEYDCKMIEEDEFNEILNQIEQGDE